MRITQGMMSAHVLQSLQGNMRRLDRLNEQLSSGKEIRLPSDDPARIARSYDLRRSLGETGRYDANLRDAKSWLNATDAALNEATTVLQRARELTVRGADGSLPQEARDAIAGEIKQLKEALLQVTETEHEGRRIFGGYKVDRQVGPPDLFTPGGGPPPTYTYAGDSGTMDYPIGPSATLQINVVGGPVFKPALDALEQVEFDLVNNPAQVGGADLAALDTALDTIIAARSVTGARTNRVEMADMRMKEFDINLKELLSKNEDVEIEEKVMELSMQEYAYRVALQVGARVLQPNLADYLR
ncbi:flagellar hook-associated protein FlgL [Limnochorda pilosa]|uniref:Flagellar hook protein n=1 Tax=Limnochorda pilosa TaxID=1555112 RepID=A0A0K2SP77_LIMPI|nr:flagellar hook-associated protein FlgL [Limnochorda pilosa]BAS28797.1 flagellar hook protein [Limnochorda pilosa]